MLTISTYNDTLTLSVNFFQSTIDKNIVGKIIDLIVLNMEACVESDNGYL